MHIQLIIQVFFSPDNGTRVYPVIWNYNAALTPNPASVAVDRHVISLSLINAPSLFSSWHADTNEWYVVFLFLWFACLDILPANLSFFSLSQH